MPPSKLAAVAVAVLLAGCSGGGDGDDDGATPSTTRPEAVVALDVVRAELVSPHAPIGPLDDDVRDDALAVVEDLLRITSAEPLVTGATGAGFARLFTDDAGERAASEDRAAFFDEGLPRFGALDELGSTVELTGLAGAMDPTTTLVVAEFVWDVESESQPGNRVTRSGELSLVPDGGAWKIAAYSITVDRTIDDQTTTTTAESDG